MVASDARRAAQTAAAFGEALRCRVHADPEFGERDLGAWTGLSRCEIERGWPGWVDAWRRRQLADPPGGETDQQVAARVARALRRHDQPDRVQVVVAHGGLLRGVLAAGGMDHADVPPLSGRWLALSPGRGRIVVGPPASL